MFHRPILTSGFGKHYTLIRRADAPLGGVLRAESFLDSNAAERFLRTLTVPSQYWQQLASQCNRYHDWRNSQRWSSLESFLASALCHGELAAFELPASDKHHDDANVVIKANNRQQYRLLPAIAELTDTIREKKQFNSQQAARRFLEQQNLSDEQLSSLASPLASHYSGSALDKVSQALIEQALFISVEQIPSAPPKPMPVEELPATAPVNSPPPAAEPAPVVEQAPQDNLELEGLQAAALISAAQAGSPICEECQ